MSIQRLELPATVGDSGIEPMADSADSADNSIRDMADAGPNEGFETHSDEGGRESHTARLLALRANIELFHSGDEAYASVRISGHRETYRVRRSGFRRWLLHQYYLKYRSTPPDESVKLAIGQFEAIARFDGPCEEVFVRVGQKNGRIYIDLGDPAWRAVEIDAAGWGIVTDVPVCFCRPSGLLALPDPIHVGKIDELRPFLNLATEEDWVLFVGSLVAAVRPRGPYFITELGGEAGSAKTTATRIFRALLDPWKAPVRSQPHDERDLMIAASNGWIVAFDNLSSLRPWLSDALCRLSTGGGFSTRALYSDDDEIIFDVQRPVLLNGIEDIVLRGDLLDRTISLILEVIEPQMRRTEAELWSEFSAAQPRILGAVYSAVSLALSWRHEVRIETLPRMADAVVWVTAAEPEFGWAAGTFKAAYESHRARLSQRAVEADVLGSAVTKLLVEAESWSGTATDLQKALASHAAKHLRNRLPATPASLGQKLRRLRPDLKANGIDVQCGSREGHDSTRVIHLQMTKPPVRAVGADRTTH
jgi:hypothetical protein